MSRPAIDQQVTFLSCRDLVASAAFYAEILGLPLVLDQGPCRLYRVTGDSFLGICSASEPDIDTASIIVTLVTAEVDAWYERLKAHDVPLEAPPARNERFNIYHFFARDPDGYRLEVQNFLDPAWPGAPGRG